MSFLEKILGGNILYYPGCLTKFVAKDLKKRYERILRKVGVDFIELSEIELCCGSPALKAGYEDDFKKNAQKNLEIFKEHSVKKIITNCPACFMVLKKEYKKVLGKDWDIEVEHITQTIANKIRNSKSKTQNAERQLVSYHDPCHLGRQMGVYDEPREIIETLGYEISEMEFAKKESFCCGGGGGVKSNEPDLANRIAKERLNQAKKTGAKILCTACPLCYLHLKENSKDIEVKEIADLIEGNL